MLQMIISNIGGSNSVLAHSYTNLLKTHHHITFRNYGIGATNSIYGLIQIAKNNILDNSDLLIYEYFVNDNNHFFQGINNVDRVNKTLVEIVNMCSKSNTKLLFVYIYNQNDKLNGNYENSPMYSLYKTFANVHNIITIDVYDLLYSKFKDGWSKHYIDDTHLSSEGMKILYHEIMDRMHLYNIPNTIEENEGFNGLHLIKLEDHLTTIHFSNSLTDVHYFIVSDEIKLTFNITTTVLALEYICDNESGYIVIHNSKNTIQKNTLKNENFVLEKNKRMVSLITFNHKLLEDDDFMVIKNIHYTDIDNALYDKEKTTYDFKHVKQNNFKIISLLVTNNATITDITVY